MIKRLRKNLEGIGKIIPKGISLDNQNQNIRWKKTKKKK